MSAEFGDISKISSEFPFNTYSSASIRSFFNELCPKEQNGPLGKFAQALWPQLLEREKIKFFQIDSGDEEKEREFTGDIFPNSSDKVGLLKKDLKKILVSIFGDDGTFQEIIKTIKERGEAILSKS